MGRPTMEDVARRAGVSRALVSLVMHDSPKVSDRSRDAVLAAAAELGYRPNLAARNLASRRTRTVGVVLNDLHNPFVPEIADGIFDATERCGYRLLMNSGFLRSASEQRALDMFLELQVDGVILVGPRLTTGAIDAAARSVPIVVVGRPLRSRRVDTVNNDEAVGARLAIDHLVELGHRCITHLDGGRGAGAAQRRAGFVAAMGRHGLEPDVVTGDFTEAGGFTAAGRLLQRSELPTAVFAANDLSAIGALDRFGEAGLEVPGDISLVGYDNVALAQLGHISMTTVDQPRQEMGALAVDTLLARLDGTIDTATVRHVVAPALRTRGTTAAPPES